MGDARILIYDIEHAPTRGWVWQKYQTDLIDIEQDWYLLCFAYKWLGEKQIKAVSLPEFELYDKDPEDDYAVAKALWDLFDEADVVIAHNGNRFDQAKARARFLVHGFAPPSPFREIDTLKVARSRFNFISNRLDDLCRQLGIGRKEKHHGARTWFDCMNGDPAAWREMIRYNKRDVEMLEELYLRFLPWIDNHPNMALLRGEEDACPNCGTVGKMVRRGVRVLQTNIKEQYRCGSCGKYATLRTSLKEPKPTYV